MNVGLLPTLAVSSLTRPNLNFTVDHDAAVPKVATQVSRDIIAEVAFVLWSPEIAL